MFGLMPYERKSSAAMYNPFQDFDNLTREFFKESGLAAFKADIRDNGSAYELEADLPGFKKEDIHIELEDNCLTIRAERRAENEQTDSKGNYVRRERSYGAFSRSFDVSGIDTEAIAAAYQDGVLKLTLPKRAEPTPTSRRLEIQ